MVTAVATRGLGDFMSSVGNIFSTIGGILGSKSPVTLSVPAECANLDTAGQTQCAQYMASVQAGQMSVASYQSWVQEQQTMATLKKYAPYALLGVGAIVVISMLRRKS